LTRITDVSQVADRRADLLQGRVLPQPDERAQRQLPRRVGASEAARLTQVCLPVLPASALRSGLVDHVIAGDAPGFRAQVAALAEQLARSPDYPALLTAKARQLAAAEKQRPLDAYRAAELAIMDRNFSDPSEPYARLRRAFVYKEKPRHTPPHLAQHRTRPWPPRPRPSSALETTALAR
jgi:putative two-component system hydrogenase maturation factor HypX/HoxX